MKAVGIILVIIIHSNTNLKMGLENSIIYPFFMVLSGYTFSVSYNRWENLQDMYKMGNVLPKLMRFLIPAIVAILLYIIANTVVGKNIDMFDVWVMGRYGQGSYYCHLMMELLIIFPLLFQVMRKNLYIGLSLAVIGNAIFEVIVKYLQIGEGVYWRLIFRYLFMVSAGILIYFRRNKKPNWLVALGSMFLGKSNEYGGKSFVSYFVHTDDIFVLF